MTPKEETLRRNNVLSDFKIKFSKIECELDSQCHNQQTEIRGKQDIINHLSQTNELLQENLKEALKRQENGTQYTTPIDPSSTGEIIDLQNTPTHEKLNDRPNVILFHDSLCNKINDTMMKNENVSITKIWSPTLGETQENLDEIDHADRIVIQGLTREVGDMTAEEFTSLTFSTVDKCLSKADKVIVSLIVDREDDLEIQAKAEAVNAMIKLNYMNDSNVLVCNHNNLRDRKYRQRRDNLHLTDPGTSRLANNLKYKIAESLNIEVVKKRKIDSGRYGDRDNYERVDNTNGRYWNNNRANNGNYERNNYFQNREFQFDRR